MADSRKEYVVNEGGIEHTYLLDDEHAKQLGLKQEKKPANKQAGPQSNK